MFRFIKCRQLLSPLKRASSRARTGRRKSDAEGGAAPLCCVSPPERKKRASSSLWRSAVPTYLPPLAHNSSSSRGRERVSSDKRHISDERHVSQEASREGCVPLQPPPPPSATNIRTLSRRPELGTYIQQNPAKSACCTYCSCHNTCLGERGPGVTVQTTIRLPRHDAHHHHHGLMYHVPS